jgi:hypothetical protein
MRSNHFWWLTRGFCFAVSSIAVQYDENAFDMGVFTRYIEELQSYEILLNYFREAAYNVSETAPVVPPRLPRSASDLFFRRID